MERDPIWQGVDNLLVEVMDYFIRPNRADLLPVAIILVKVGFDAGQLRKIMSDNFLTLADDTEELLAHEGSDREGVATSMASYFIKNKKEEVLAQLARTAFTSGHLSEEDREKIAKMLFFHAVRTENWDAVIDLWNKTEYVFPLRSALLERTETAGHLVFLDFLRKLKTKSPGGPKIDPPLFW